MIYRNKKCVGNVLFPVTRKIITMYSFCFLSVPVNFSQLQLNLNPNQNDINSPYIPFHNESSRWFKKKPLEHLNQIMYIKQFSRIFYYCPLNKSSSTQQFVSTVSNLLEEFQHTHSIKVKISFNILPLWETLQSSLSFCKLTPMIRSAFVCLPVLVEPRSIPLLTVFISRSRISCSGLSMVYSLLF